MPPWAVGLPPQLERPLPRPRRLAPVPRVRRPAGARALARVCAPGADAAGRVPAVGLPPRPRPQQRRQQLLRRRVRQILGRGRGQATLPSPRAAHVEVRRHCGERPPHPAVQMPRA